MRSRVLGWAAVVFLYVGEAKAQQGACMAAHRCQTFLANGLVGSSRHAQLFVDAGTAYVTTRQGLMRVASNGGATAPPMVSSTVSPTASSFVIDHAKLCWTELGAIKCQALTGGAATTIGTFPATQYLTALVQARSTFYWIQDGEWIQSMSTSGGAVTTIAHVAPNAYRGPYHDIVERLATDGTALYWASRVLIQSRPLGGGTIVTIAKPTSPLNLRDFKVDGTEVFTVDPSHGVQAFSVVGGNWRSVVAPPAWADQIALDAGRLYWADSMSGALSSIATTGGAITQYPTVGSPVAVAVDTTSVYYLSRQGDLVKITPK